MDIKVIYTIEGFSFEAVLSTKEDKNEFLKQMKYMKQDLIEKGLINNEPVKAAVNNAAPVVQPAYQQQSNNQNENGPLTQRQYGYLINLGALPEEISNLTRNEATKLIHDIKRNKGWE